MLFCIISFRHEAYCVIWDKLENVNPIYSFSSNFGKKYTGEFLKSNLAVYFLSQNVTFPHIDFYELFYRIEEEEQNNKFVSILNVMDNSITNIKTIGADGPMPQIKQEHNINSISLSIHGDATKQLFKYFTPLFEREVFKENLDKELILLIDEIENGLHYTAHEEFWQHIFKLSKELNVQVFATTHSLEMIKAFNAVAKEQGEGAYFELSREYDTQNIFAFKHDTDLLTYELSKDDTTIRG